MKGFRRVLFAMMSFCMLLCASSGCTQQNPAQNPATQKPVQTHAPVDASLNKNEVISLPNLSQAQALIAPKYDDPGQKTAGPGANDFSFRLVSALTGKQENMVVSPYSIWMSLAALSNATDEAAMEPLMNALGLDGFTADALNTSVSRMLYALTNNEGSDRHNPLSIANAVFVDQSVTLDKEFSQEFLDYYRGTAMQVDFSAPSAVDAINEWASKHTEGLIPDIVKEIPEETILALANAIYFSDRWSWEFDPADTEEMPFHGTTREVPAPFMLRDGSSLPYYEDADMQVIRLSFLSGGSLTILLPKNGDANSLMQDMSAQRFSEICGHIFEHPGKLLLPRFDISSAYTLNDTLIALGIPLFDSTSPAITSLVEETDAYIASCVHQATIRVDEKGTTAAAVTVELAAGSAMPMPAEPFEMVCDKPFAFVLTRYADATEQVLFCGIVNQL